MKMNSLTLCRRKEIYPTPSQLPDFDRDQPIRCRILIHRAPNPMADVFARRAREYTRQDKKARITGRS